MPSSELNTAWRRTLLAASRRAAEAPKPKPPTFSPLSRSNIPGEDGELKDDLEEFGLGKWAGLGDGSGGVGSVKRKPDVPEKLRRRILTSPGEVYPLMLKSSTPHLLSECTREGIVYSDLEGSAKDEGDYGVALRPGPPPRSLIEAAGGTVDAPLGQELSNARRKVVNWLTMGHRDRSDRAWLYIIALPRPEPTELFRPRPYEPYDPRYVPVPAPLGSQLHEERKRLEKEAKENAERQQEEVSVILRAVLNLPSRRHRQIEALKREEEAQEEEKLEGAPESRGTVMEEYVEKMRAHVPVLRRVKEVPARHNLFCTFFRATENRVTVVGGLPAMVINAGIIATNVPPMFGGFRVMRRPSVAPAHVPDVVRMEHVGGLVDISNVVYVGPDAAASLQAAMGEEGDGIFDEWVNEIRIDDARKLLPFGSSELEEWEKEDLGIQQKKDAAKQMVRLVMFIDFVPAGHQPRWLFSSTKKIPASRAPSF